MSGDVQATLNELERKLRELQAELRGSEAATPAVSEAPPPVTHEPPPPPAPAPARGPLHDQLDELLRFRDQLAEAANRLVDDYTRLLKQLERVAQAPAPPTAAVGHVTFPVPEPAPSSPESALHAGPVVIEAAPFEDIAAVMALETALRAIPHAEDVRVRSFDAGRAVVDLRLGGETALVFELRRASDQGFDVQHAEPGRLELAMHPAGDLPFPMRP